MIRLLLVLMICSPAFAEEMDAASKEALEKTQKMLRDPTMRKKAAGESKEGAAAAQRIESIGGSEKNTQDIYDLSADIFETLAKEANGDPQKMMELLQKAQKDPESFGKKFTPAQREQLRNISGNVTSPAPKAKP